jgi:glyoxylase-like metal-dependent hydrolase (beta-lactamase superfamily II)
MKIERFVCGSLEANGYVVYQKDGGACYIIDPGYKAELYRQFVRLHELKPKAILLTHTHSDHSGKAAALAEDFGCPVLAHREEADYYDGRIDDFLEDGKPLDLDGETLMVLHSPGHTAGGLCFYSGKNRAAFTGDTIFNVDTGYTHFAGGSAARMKETIKNVVDKWDNGVTIYPGHGDPASMKYVREHNAEFNDYLK